METQYRTQIRMDQKMEKHFVLVHGACHGAWCWYKVATLLRSAGHKVTVLDLAASGLNQKKIQEVKSFSVYLEPLMEFMASLLAEEKVVLVGHSMGGVALSVAMERFPEKVSVAVFTTAYMLNPDLNLLSISEKVEKNIDSNMDSQVMFDDGLDKRPTSFLFGPKMLESMVYQLTPPEASSINFRPLDLTLASMLVRPHPTNTDTISLEETKVTKERFGSVRRVYVIADQDIILPEEIQRWMIELNPPDEVKVISGSDHMVMLCKPRDLCTCLEEVSLQYY
ncbi:Polyneuridine-aldehyde esterase [Heracleum sosnowskyi]|uniref:Polyneuridine-aldehyde esterase n=1 Tax=Heracleum sosnowskyi TaxID=360622 RepID=A0AAD8M8U4_9APIA|nr:Polyneuridine-aldehyde esterase [Heracleum sosnowskyi]